MSPCKVLHDHVAAAITTRGSKVDPGVLRVVADEFAKGVTFDRLPKTRRKLLIEAQVIDVVEVRLAAGFGRRGQTSGMPGVTLVGWSG